VAALSNPVVRSLLAIALPLVVFFGGVGIMASVGGRSPGRAPDLGKPLNQRWRGYGVEDVTRQWGDPAGPAIAVERRLLEIDLVFPFAYGGALAAGLLIAWAGLGRPFNPFWIIGLVALGMLADWTENLVQLAQLNRYGVSALQPSWIAVASAATVVKLAALGSAFLALVVLAALLALGGRPADS
jgi:hypothetical protein